MTVSLARRLTWEGVVAPEDANDALYRHVTERISFLQGLVERHPEMAERLELELGHPADPEAAPIEPDPALLARLPHGLTVSLAALPVQRDPTTGVVRVLAAHPTDAHMASELSFHLEAPVEVSGAPLTAILAALAPSSSAPPRSRTPAFGTSASPASASSAAAANADAHPSEPPIPLVRRNLEPSPPSTARHGSLAPPSPVSTSARPTSLTPIRPEPIIALTGTRPEATPSPPVVIEDAKRTPSGKESVPPAALLESELSALDDLAQAGTPEEVVAALVAGLATVAATVVVLAARGKSFEGRDASDARVRQAVRTLVVPIDRPSILQTAVQSMGYVGPIPSTPIHQELSSVLGDPEGEVAVGAVMVTGRAALVYVMSGLTTTYLATRRGDKLGDAAGKALARIVRGRKK
jgi:hypothetical protein